MTRVIGGTAGGRRLRTPEGAGTRPTTDRVREALFSAVEAAVGSWDGLRFLDLYAGSGAVGLEARSRGAAAVTLVEQDRRAASVIAGNLRELGFTGVAVVRQSVARFLAEPGTADERYDVAFLDPPYSLAAGELRVDLERLGAGWLAPGALVVVERSSRDGDVPWPPGYEPGRVRRYGETTLSYAAFTGRDG